MKNMREPSYDNVQKEDLLKKCFEYLIETGLENVSMRKMCDETGMAMSSVYYWFGNKDGAIMNATEYGLNYVSEIIFEFVYKYIDNLECTIITFPEFIMKYKEQLRFIYQVVTSHKYGNDIRLIANRLSEVYEHYAEKVAEHFKCSKFEVLPYVYLFVSAVLDYVIWHDEQKIEIELSCIYNALKKAIKY